tara:strand:+ start:5595 stop:6362 length:768 start_codon:yes stop_codon:yes gene_type:complete
MATRKIKNNRIARLFVKTALTGESITLNTNQTHYLRQVLRLRSGDPLLLFNGMGDERHARVETLARSGCKIRITDISQPLPESPLRLSLLQSIAKADAMDLIIQKSAELGVSSVFPILSSFSVVKIDEGRVARKIAHWEKIAQSACEQSGRHCPPIIHAPINFRDILGNIPSTATCIVLRPGSSKTLQSFSQNFPHISDLYMLIGPEGGFSPSELEDAKKADFHFIDLGTRILRTETAALAACTLAQYLWGDLSV